MQKIIIFTLFALFSTSVFADFSGKWNAIGTMDDYTCATNEIDIDTAADELFISEFNLYCNQFAVKHFEVLFKRNGNDILFENEKVGTIFENGFLIEFKAFEQDIGAVVDVKYEGILQSNGTFKYHESYTLQGDNMYNLELILTRVKR